MNRAAVSSSNIRSVGFDPEFGVLEVEFHSGSVYQYAHVPHSLVTLFLSASSKGSFFNARIRDRFTTKQIK